MDLTPRASRLRETEVKSKVLRIVGTLKRSARGNCGPAFRAERVKVRPGSIFGGIGVRPSCKSQNLPSILFTIGGFLMKHRAVLVALLLVGVMTVVGLVEVRGLEESEDEPHVTPEKALEPELASGCFDIKVNPKTARQSFLLNKCTGETWNAVRDGLEGPLVWERMRKY